MRQMIRAVMMAVVAASLTACASAPADMSSGPTLYQRLGGREAIKGVVDDFVANMAADPRVNSRFKGLQPAAVFAPSLGGLPGETSRLRSSSSRRTSRTRSAMPPAGRAPTWART